MGVEKPLKRFKKDKSKKQDIDISKLIKKGYHQVDIALMQTPIKSKPCKGCPALANGLCKCAFKRLNKQ